METKNLRAKSKRSMYLRVYDGKIVPSSEIKFDTCVTGHPVKADGDFVLKWDYLWDGEKLWDLIGISSAFKAEGLLPTNELLNCQDTLETVHIKTAAGIEARYQIGEIQIEALVKLHERSTYYDVFNIEHPKNSIGEVVGLRWLYLPKSKLNFRSGNLKEYWADFPDRLITGRVSYYGVKAAEIKNGDRFILKQYNDYLYVEVEDDKLPFETDHPSRKVCVRFLDYDPWVDKELCTLRYYHPKINQLIPLDNKLVSSQPVTKLADERREKLLKIKTLSTEPDDTGVPPQIRLLVETLFGISSEGGFSKYSEFSTFSKIEFAEVEEQKIPENLDTLDTDDENFYTLGFYQTTEGKNYYAWTYRFEAR